MLAASDFEMKTATKVNKILTVGLNYFVPGVPMSATERVPAVPCPPPLCHSHPAPAAELGAKTVKKQCTRWEGGSGFPLCVRAARGQQGHGNSLVQGWRSP